MIENPSAAVTFGVLKHSSAPDGTTNHPKLTAGAGQFRSVTETELLLIKPATGSQQNLQRTIRRQRAPGKNSKYFY
jgi:hypothetical protein